MTVLCMILALLALPGPKITADLQQQMLNAAGDQRLSCIVFMEPAYPYEALSRLPRRERIPEFRRIARESQADLLEWLGTMPADVQVRQAYWVFNGIHLEATTGVILELAKRADVAWISHDGDVRIAVDGGPAVTPPGRAVEWNILKIMADSCWAAGFTGQGIILGETDTGVDHSHPALQGKWSGYWFDAINGQATPYDDHNHGTHCMGTIMGGDGDGPFADDIGIAYQATFAAAKVLNSGGSGTYAQCASGLQFMADIKDSVDVKAVSNSWSGSNAADTFFYPVCRTYITIGIVPVFANGNSGPNPSTVGCPGANSNVIGVGATDNADAIANFSSRGPSPNQAPFNDPSTWLRDDWNLTKPQISAPGVSVRSCIPGNQYATWNGTSMATPHVTGSIGLISQKNPNLSPVQIYAILLDNVDEPAAGAPYPNNNYGWGRLNVWKALSGTPTMDQPWISLLSKSLTDPPPGGNNNGLMEPGETGLMAVTIKNTGGADALNTVGRLESFDNFVTVSNATYSFGNLAPGGEASNSASPYQVHCHSLTPPGHQARIGLILHADGAHDSLDFDDTLYHNFTIGAAPEPFVIYEDDFEYGSGLDSFPDYWDRTGNWNRSTREAHSPTHSAFSGAASDSARFLTLKNAVDLSAFPQPRLRLWHCYAFDQGIFMDSAAILVSTNGGSSWSALWGYDWLGGNTLPWTEENFNLPAAANVKVRFHIDGYTFFQDSTDWFVDDFEIYTPADNEPPYFTNTTDWPDTAYTGPFPVQSTVADQSGVDSVRLHYRVNSGSWQALVMTLQSGNLYQASIPAQATGSVVDYYLWARDRWITPNSGCDPVGAPGDGCYSFQIGPTAVEEGIRSRIGFACRSSNPARGRIAVEYSLPQALPVRCRLYDAAGRLVRSLADGIRPAGPGRLEWQADDDIGRRVPAGVYFVDFSAGSRDGFRRIEKLVLVE